MKREASQANIPVACSYAVTRLPMCRVRCTQNHDCEQRDETHGLERRKVDDSLGWCCGSRRYLYEIVSSSLQLPTWIQTRRPVRVGWTTWTSHLVIHMTPMDHLRKATGRTMTTQQAVLIASWIRLACMRLWFNRSHMFFYSRTGAT